MEEPEDNLPRRRRSSRRKSFSLHDDHIVIRIGDRRTSGYHQMMQARSAVDAPRFLRMVEESVLSNPRDPIIMYHLHPLPSSLVKH